MKVVNYNEFFRKELSKLNLKIIKTSHDIYHDYSKLFYYIKDSSTYNYLLGLMFESSYLITNLSLKFYPNDEDFVKNISYLKSFSSIDEFKESLTINSFINLLEDINYFCDSDFYFKRNLVECSMDDKDYLISVFPCFLIDAFAYLNKYDASIILDEYQERVERKDDNAFNNTVMTSVEDLINVEEKDFSSYKYIILEMMESYYIYKKYLLSNNLLEDELDIYLVHMIEDDLFSTIHFSISNIKLLNKIVSGYLEYNLLSVEKINEIHEYNDKNNKEIYVKVMRKSYRLKNQ